MPPRDPASDAQLAAALARCADRDRSALRVVYGLEADRMIAIAMRIVRRRDLAEDAVHEAFMRVWRSARSFDAARGTPRQWLYTIARNCALTLLRDENRFAASADGDAPEPEQITADDALTRLPETSRLRQCLDRLDLSKRKAVTLAYVHGLTHGEIAGRLAVPLGTAKSWTRRGLLSLQECMG